MIHPMIEHVEAEFRKPTTPEFQIGDTVAVHVKIVEGDKERVQAFNGVVIARSGRGLTETFKVRRIVGNEGVERTFQVHSPLITRIEVQRSGKTRRAKLYFLRDRVGKKRKLREDRSTRATMTTATTTRTRGGKQSTAAEPNAAAAAAK
jgi:large subunit ribosomal protein L19